MSYGHIINGERQNYYLMLTILTETDYFLLFNLQAPQLPISDDQCGKFGKEPCCYLL
jgi:hypothetical protein